MRRLHLTVGVVSLVAFLLTGQYMDRVLDYLAGMADLPRMLYRSGHIYLLFGSLLNLLLGVYLTQDVAGWRRGAARVGSFLILIAPVLLLIGFTQEPARTDFERPFAGPAIYGCLAGVLLHAISGLTAPRTQPAPAAVLACVLAVAAAILSTPVAAQEAQAARAVRQLPVGKTQWRCAPKSDCVRRGEVLLELGQEQRLELVDEAGRVHAMMQFILMLERPDDEIAGFYLRSVWVALSNFSTRCKLSFNAALLVNATVRANEGGDREVLPQQAVTATPVLAEPLGRLSAWSMSRQHGCR